MKETLLALCLFLSIGLNAQLNNGSLAPGFNITDLDGNDHHLYDYLEDGKHVILDFSATWCPPCWNYHETGILDEVYDEFGPNGLDDIKVIFIEGDGNTAESCLYGGVCSGGTLGDWTTVNYPLVNLTGSDLNIVNSYKINAWPTIYIINAEHETVWNIGQVSASTWEQIIEESFTLQSQVNITSGVCGTGEISLNATGGYGSISYEWSSGETTSEIIAETGYYDVTITDDFGYFIAFYDIYIENSETDFVFDDEDVQHVSCDNGDDGSVYVDIDSDDQLSYAWSHGDDDAFASGLSSDTYYLTVENTVNGCMEVFEYEINEPEGVEISSSTIHTLCGYDNGQIILEGSGGTGGFEYILEGLNNSTGIFENLGPGVYDINVIDDNDCSEEIELEIFASDSLAISLVGLLNLDCLNTETLITFESNSINPLVHQWRTQDTIILSEDSFIAIADSGSYQLIVTDEELGCSQVLDFMVTLDTIITDVELEGFFVLECDVESTNISTNIDDSAGYDFHWIGIDSSNMHVESFDSNIDINEVGVYQLEVIDTTNGCISIVEFEIEAEENSLIASFSLNAIDGDYILEDSSIGYGYSEWWVIDGIPVTPDENGMIVFEQNGFYEICLTIENICGVSMVCQTIEITGITSTNEHQINELIEVNWYRGYLKINNQFSRSLPSMISIYTMDGKLLNSKNRLLSKGVNNIDMDIDYTGLVLVNIETEFGSHIEIVTSIQW